jgi:hypothetical protein
VCGELGGDFEDVQEQRQRECQSERDKQIEPAAAEVPSATLEQQLQEAA